MKWKNYNEEDCMYFVTTTLRKYTPLFLDDKIVNIIFDSLSFLRKNKGLKVYAYVVMPEHIHLVVDLFRSEATQGFRREDTQGFRREDTPKHQNVSVLIGDFKRFTSRQIAEYLQLESPLLFKKCKAFAYKGQNYAIWQETFRPR